MSGNLNANLILFVGTKRTLKPLNITEKIIRNSSKENNTVLDPFMGSGTTGVACINTNRDFIGIELDKKYYKIAEERINSATK
jgi:site-specific DNA-methyltransferase (adenine-specific)